MYYKDTNNTLHFLDSSEFEDLLPADCTPITDEEAQVMQADIEANQPAPVELTPQEKLASAGLTVGELKDLLGIAV